MTMRAIYFLLAFTVSVFLHAGETSENSPRLKDALKRYPKADANGDGVLSLDEARTYREKLAKETAQSTDTPDPKNEGAANDDKKHIYKEVGGKKLPLYVYKPDGHKADAKVPAIVLFHGGGFKSGSADQFAKQAEYFAARGMVAVSVTYRLTSDPAVKLDDCIEDAKSAMRWMRANAAKFGIDPDRIASGGGSAGGYLAAATLLLDFANASTDPADVSAKPNAMVLFNPWPGTLNEDGKQDPRDPEGKLDLRKYVKPNLPPCIQFFGTEDKFLSGAKQLQESYKKKGNRCEILTYEGVGHGFFNQSKYLALTLAEADKFLVGLGWLAKKAE